MLAYHIFSGIISVGGVILSATPGFQVVGPILIVSGLVLTGVFAGGSGNAYDVYILDNEEYQNEINIQVSNYNDIKKKK